MDKIYKYTFLESVKYNIRKETYFISKKIDDNYFYRTSENTDTILNKINKNDLEKIFRDEDESVEAYSMYSLDGNKILEFADDIIKQVKEKLDNDIKELQRKKSMLNGVKVVYKAVKTRY